MYTFRFNPVFEQWVMLGNPVATDILLKPSHMLGAGRHKDFVAATYPKQPFVLDPEGGYKSTATHERLYADSPAVGEYELLLYKGDQRFFGWDAKTWDKWLSFAQQRIVQAHHNPHVHYLQFTLATDALLTVHNYQRVGDLVATSHPIAGTHPILTPELAEKLCKKESVYTIADNGRARLHVPSAPLNEREFWVIPSHYRSGLEKISKEEREDIAELLSLTFRALNREFPQDNYYIQFYTHLSSMQTEGTWWIRAYKKVGEQSAISTRSFPESFVRTLGLLFKSGGR
jgi:hypothetical protein